MSSVYSDKFEGVAFRSGAELAQFEADARALWAVRVLDAWASKPGLCWKLECSHGRYRVTHWSAYDSEHGLLGDAPTPDAARVAAAEALVAEDPTLGEGL